MDEAKRIEKEKEQNLYEFFQPSGCRNIYHGEFDPGSERTLAARLKHASRAVRVAILRERRTGE